MSALQNRPYRVAVYCRLSKAEIEPASGVSGIGNRIFLLTDHIENLSWNIFQTHIHNECYVERLKYPDFQRIRLPENLRHRQSTAHGKDGGNG